MTDLQKGVCFFIIIRMGSVRNEGFTFTRFIWRHRREVLLLSLLRLMIAAGQMESCHQKPTTTIGQLSTPKMEIVAEIFHHWDDAQLQ